MLLLFSSARRHGLPITLRNLSRPVFFNRFVRCIGVLCAALALTGVPQRSSADPVRIFLYQTGSAPQEVTASYSYAYHHLYDPLGALVGNVDASGHATNLSGQAIGYVVFIYLYDAHGVPQDVTASYHYADHHLYDPLANLMGNVNVSGAITGLTGQPMGYLTFIPGS